MAKLSASNDTSGASDSQITRVEISPKQVTEMTDAELEDWLTKLRGNRTMSAPRKSSGTGSGNARVAKPKLLEQTDDNEELG